jgi:S1-C subfamily serine protease
LVLLVQAVVEGGVAEAGGAQVNDVLLAVNGDSIGVVENNTPELFKEYIADLPRPLLITFERKYVFGV